MTNVKLVPLAAVLVVLAIILSVAAGIPFRLNLDRTGIVYVDEPIMARSVDAQSAPIDPTSVFSIKDRKIYASVSIRGPDGVRVGARWYHNEQLIYDKVIDFGTQRRGAFWLEMAEGQTFPLGF